MEVRRNLKIRRSDAARGATLVLVLLVMLGISAISVVALNSVSRSVEHSGVFRVRTQASQLSSAVATIGIETAKDVVNQPNPPDLLMASRTPTETLEETPLNSSLTTEYRTEYQRNFFDNMFQGGAGTDEGLFSDDSEGALSFEDSVGSHNFAVAYEPSFKTEGERGAAEANYQRVVIYTRAQLGKFSSNWNDSQQQVGVARHVIEAKARLGD